MIVPEKKVKYLYELSYTERAYLINEWSDAFCSVVGYRSHGVMLLHQGEEAGQNIPHLHAHVFAGDILINFPFLFLEGGAVEHLSQRYFRHFVHTETVGDESVTIHRIVPRGKYIYLREVRGSIELQTIMMFWIEQFILSCRDKQGNLLMIQDGEMPIQFYVIERNAPRRENNPHRKPELKTRSILEDGEFISPQVEEDISELRRLVRGK
ncbi:MAG: HIT domain-containing protein [Candidatus Absconditabacteria bacterium]|nr:HIT domain-containing protein [Candidatus Absconditabacteria bacterium]MDD3868446.1 HIT domain-containing protein [Candidatus Absconditabacteria bacterium]